jgi:hypothetical protein
MVGGLGTCGNGVDKMLVGMKNSLAIIAGFCKIFEVLRFKLQNEDFLLMPNDFLEWLYHREIKQPQLHCSLLLNLICKS